MWLQSYVQRLIRGDSLGTVKKITNGMAVARQIGDYIEVRIP